MHLNCPPRFEIILKFTYLEWLKIHLPWLETYLEWLKNTFKLSTMVGENFEIYLS